MIYFGTGEPTLRITRETAFRARLHAVMRAEGRDRPLRWVEAPDAPPPATVAHRRMLERLLLGTAAGGVPPGWVSPGVAGVLTAQPSPTSGGPGAGAAYSGRVLLVGDRPGSRWGQRAPTWPFISENRQGCSAWLADELERAGVGEERLYWINAFTVSDTHLPHATLLKLPMWGSTVTLTVALGRNAAAWCNEGMLPCVEVHHPAYWVRAHKGDAYHLIKLLRNHLYA